MENKEDLFQSQQTAGKLLSRDFIFGFLAFFTYMFALFVLVPTLPIYLLKLGSSEGEIGVLVGIFSVSSLASRLLAGPSLARFSEKSVMIFAALLFAVTFIAYIVLRPFWPLIFVRLFQGVAYAFLDTAILALIVKITPLELRGKAIGYLMLAPGIATALAPSLGMFFVNRFGFTIFFFSCIAVALCALLFSSTLKAPKPARPDTDTGAAGHHSFFLERKIIAPAVSGFFYNFVMGSVMAFFPLYGIQCGMANPGYFFSVSAIVTIAGRALGGKIYEAWSKETIILAFTSTAMAAMAILSFSTTLPMFIFVGLLWGAGIAFIFPVSMIYALEYAGSSGGTAVSTFRAFMDLGYALGPMAMGNLIPLTGYRGMFLCLAFICLVNLCYFQFYVRKTYRRNRGDVSQAA